MGEGSSRRYISPHGKDVMNRISGNQTLVTINSQSEYDALPSGSEYVDSDGKRARKK
jgi:hypothetical protein